MRFDEAVLDDLVKQVRESTKYGAIDPQLIRSLGKAELQKRGSLKEAVKTTRNKLHQVGSAYQEKPIPYSVMQDQLEVLPNNLMDPQVQEFLRSCMRMHASTRERLNIHQAFFKEVLHNLMPLHSVLDLACGLNPLNFPWIPVTPDCEYHACDIYSDMLQFLNSFFAHFQVQGTAFSCDLTQTVPQQPAQIAFLLKTIPCLEQIDKNIGARLLDELQTETILVSFPAHSLGGRSKGMVRNYEVHFRELISGKPWSVTRYEFGGELAFLVQK